MKNVNISKALYMAPSAKIKMITSCFRHRLRVHLEESYFQEKIEKQMVAYKPPAFPKFFIVGIYTIGPIGYTIAATGHR